MIETDNDDFKLVKYNSRRKNKIKVKVEKQNNIVQYYSVDEIVNKINSAVQKFKESQFQQSLFIELNKSLKVLNLSGVDEIICYGLGNFSEHISSKYQLAALLSIKSVYSSKVYIYDPQFTKNEIDSLKQLNLLVIEDNEEGKRVINDCCTLVFMPHCSKQLTNNFLFANWNSLISKCILLGNSWSDLESHTTDALLEQSVYFINKLKSYVTEIKLKNNFEYSNTFSGTSLHIFTQEKLNTVPSDFWKIASNLVLNYDDPEFIRKN